MVTPRQVIMGQVGEQRVQGDVGQRLKRGSSQVSVHREQVPGKLYGRSSQLSWEMSMTGC